MSNEEIILKILTEIQTDINQLKTDSAQMKTDINQLKATSATKYDLNEIKEDIKYIKIGNVENKLIFDALLHNSEVHKSEIDKINIEMSKVSALVKKMKHDLYTVEAITGQNFADIALIKQISDSK